MLENRDAGEPHGGAFTITTRPHSAAVLKLINRDLAIAPRVIAMEHADGGSAGETLTFSAQGTSGDLAVSYLWSFGDGVIVDGAHVSHAWIEPGDYQVRLSAKGLSDETTDQAFRIHITGYMSTIFAPESNRRYSAPQ